MGCGATSNDASEDVEVPSGDPFARGQLIGVGNHGIVYRCKHQPKHHELAIKVISQLNYLETGKFSK